uniref:Uncharacterized protein n=1 Tax=Panagrolaimus sp. PS1159 TaxID=55785 RepID=A0AC35FRF7_9BILA
MSFDQSLLSTASTGETKKKVVEDLLWLRKECDQRCLYETAQWAEECLVFQENEIVDETEFIFDEKPNTSTSVEIRTRFVRSLIYNKEFHRAVFFAEQLPEPLNPQHAFLLYFSSYLVCLEKQAQECPDRPEYALNRDDVVAPQLSRKIQLLRYESPESFDCWMFYLLGLILKMTHDENKARVAFMEAINLDHRCWPAWESLALLLKEKTEILTFKLPRTTWQYKLFLAKSTIHLNILRDAVDILDDLMKKTLGTVPYIVCENAVAVSSLQEHGSAVSMFQLVRKIDPYRIEHMNNYSDSLFVHRDSDALYILGRFFEKSHKYTWQCCQILANYFASVKQHDRAHSLLITATRLSPRNSLLWVLLGHACVELKNPTDAVSAYRKAIAIDPDLFQAYYAMGQVYEIFGFPEFALRFYEQAHRCRPSDSRMLVAMGVGFVQLRRFKDAENAFIKAFRVGDVQGNALKKLGHLYEEIKEPEKAAKVYTTFLKVYGEDNHSGIQMIAKSCLYLAQYFYDQNKYDKASEYIERCVENEYTKESALKIQREIQMKNALALDEKNSIPA